MIPAEHSPDIEPPRETVGRIFPKWVRIGLWGVLVFVLGNLLILLRLSFGLQDPPEVTALKTRGATISYDKQGDSIPFLPVLKPPRKLDLLTALLSGLRGRTSGDVTAISLTYRATDDDLRTMAQSFRNVESLNFSRTEITVAGLRELGSLPRLRWLNLSATDVDDRLTDLLPQFPNLAALKLNDTPVGDPFVERLLNVPPARLNDLWLQGTCVTPATAARLKAEWLKTRTWDRVNYEPIAGTATIHWRDERRSRRYSQACHLHWLALTPSSASNVQGVLSRAFFTPKMPQFLPKLQAGTYHLTLMIGPFESIPVTVTMEDGRGITEVLEFVMPCTKEEALRSAR